MRNIFIFGILVLIFAAGAFLWHVTSSTSKSEQEEINTPERITQTTNTTSVADLEVAGLLASTLSEYDPSLTDDVKRAISQNYNGVPLSTVPGIHTVTAKDISCEYSEKEDTPSTICRVSFAGQDPQLLPQDKSKDVYVALKKAGIEEAKNGDDLAMVDTITAESVECTVDDSKIQSSPGDNIQGFSCTIHTTQSISSTAQKIKRYQQCVFTKQGEDYFVSPCTVQAMADGVITVGVSENDGLPANPFFYLSKGDGEVAATASWNEAEITRTRADAPLPGTWSYQDTCFVGEDWKLCFPEDISSVLE